MDLHLVITDEGCGHQAKNGINDCKQHFDPNDVRKVFFDQKAVPGDIPAVEVGNSDIEEDVQDDRKIEKSEVKAIIFGSNHILNGSVNAQDPERLDQQVKENQ